MQIQNCYKCDACSNRMNIVNGKGNNNAYLMFVGECPGYYEDKWGVPFIGASGKELQKYLDMCAFKREDIYITNAVKCKVIGRAPNKTEVKKCRMYLFEEIIEIKPRIIVLLGVTAFYSLFPNYSLPYKTIRGLWIPIWNKHIILTYHPSYLLRYPEYSGEYVNHFKRIVDKYREIVNPNHQVNY